MNGNGEVFDLHEILVWLKLNMRQFQQLCVATGCDYLTNVKGIGVHQVLEMSLSGDILRALVKKGADE